MSAVRVPGLMCDNADGCDQYDIDPTMGGLATIVDGSPLPNGWTEPEPGLHLCWYCSECEPAAKVVGA